MNESAIKHNSSANNSQNQSKMHEIVCSLCGKKTKVIFEPEPGRKVYCKSCLKKLQATNNNSKPISESPLVYPSKPQISLNDLSRLQPQPFSRAAKNESTHIKKKLILTN